MVFMSYNHKDKEIVEDISIKIAETIGYDKVFYDSWSIQPGDGIIDKMDEGLRLCKFFFFYVSKNSLQSNMVKLEWQAALLKATKGECKFIPVRIDGCEFPIVFMQIMNIDIYEQGLDVGVRQIIDVINGANTFRPKSNFSNLRAIVRKCGTKIFIEIKAQFYMEPISKYGILISNSEDEIKYKITSDSGITINGFNKDIILKDGTKCNAIYVEVLRATTPDYPLVIELNEQEPAKLKLLGVLKGNNNTDYRGIPVIFV